MYQTRRNNLKSSREGQRSLCRDTFSSSLCWLVPLGPQPWPDKDRLIWAISLQLLLRPDLWSHVKGQSVPPEWQQGKQAGWQSKDLPSRSNYSRIPYSSAIFRRLNLTRIWWHCCISWVLRTKLRQTLNWSTEGKERERNGQGIANFGVT